MTGALLLSMAIALLTGPKLIAYLKKLHFGQTIYELGPSHQQKQGTPVMGGLMMAAGILVSSLVFHPVPWNGGWDAIIPLLAVAFLSMAVGFADDYIKAVKKRHDGLSPWQKIAGQVIVAVGFSVYCYFNPNIGSRIRVPFAGTEWDLGIFYIPLMTLLTGFLRYNRYPAKTFMGDTGSMLLGGGTVAMALVLRLPLLLILIFFTPIMSSVSVIMQRYYFKLTHGKRIFLMSPIHHHFEKKGYSETQIVGMYAGITLVLSLIAIVSISGM